MPASSSRSPLIQKISASGPRGAVRWGYYLFLLLIPLALAGYAAYQTWFFYTHYGPVAATYRPRMTWLAAAIAGLAALILLIRARWRSRTYLRIEPRGIVLHVAPRNPLALPWEAITGVQLHLARTLGLFPHRWRGNIILHRSNGTTAKIDSRFPDLPHIAQEIQRRWYAFHLPALRRAWASGERIAFGKLQISTAGLHWRGNTYPWRTVRGMTIQNGRLVIELTHQKPIRIPLHHILNPHVLLWWLHEEAKR